MKFPDRGQRTLVYFSEYYGSDQKTNLTKEHIIELLRTDGIVFRSPCGKVLNSEEAIEEYWRNSK